MRGGNEFETLLTEQAPDRNLELLRYVEAETIMNPEEFALVVVDLDDFKHINTVYGHPEGDEYLANVLDIFQTTVRTRDESPSIPGQRQSSDDLPQRGRAKDTVLASGTAIHAHGDEYWIVLRGITDYQDVKAFIARMQTILYDLGIGASMGGIVHSRGQTAMDMYRIADARASIDKLMRVPVRSPEQEDELLATAEWLEWMDSSPRAFEKEIEAIRFRRAVRNGEIPEILRIAKIVI